MRIIYILLIVPFAFSCKTDSTNNVSRISDKIEIGENISLTSKILNEDRDIYISLPSNYDNSIHNYPIILVMDAEYLFEITNAIVKIKASRNEMPESIIVGLPKVKRVHVNKNEQAKKLVQEIYKKEQEIRSEQVNKKNRFL